MAWPVSDMLGRQAALILSGVPALAGWLMITYSYLAATHSAFLGVIYTGRVLTGFSTGWSIFCVSVSVHHLYNICSTVVNSISILLCLLVLFSGVHS